MIEPTPEQAAFLEKPNPCFKERPAESARPGQLLLADTSLVGTLEGIGRVHPQAVVDTFGALHVGKQPEAAVAVPHNEALPFHAALDRPGGPSLTGNGRAVGGTGRHPHELSPALNDIAPRKTRVGTPRTNLPAAYAASGHGPHGSIARFHGTVPEEFFQPTLRRRFHGSGDAPQAELEAWLHHHDPERPQPRPPQPGPKAIGNGRALRQARRSRGRVT